MDIIALINCIIGCLSRVTWWEWLLIVGLGILAGLITLLGSYFLGIVGAITAIAIAKAIVGGILGALLLRTGVCIGSCFRSTNG